MNSKSRITLHELQWNRQSLPGMACGGPRSETQSRLCLVKTGRSGFLRVNLQTEVSCASRRRTGPRRCRRWRSRRWSREPGLMIHGAVRPETRRQRCLRSSRSHTTSRRHRMRSRRGVFEVRGNSSPRLPRRLMYPLRASVPPRMTRPLTPSFLPLLGVAYRIP